MDLIPISESQLINADLIEAVEFRKVKGQKVFSIVVGGKSYTPDVDSTDLLSLLIKKGVVKSTNQFFAI